VAAEAPLYTASDNVGDDEDGIGHGRHSMRIIEETGCVCQSVEVFMGRARGRSEDKEDEGSATA